MKRCSVFSLTVAASTLAAATAFAQGQSIFKAKCASCHPSGGNTINKEKTLFKKDLDKNKLKTVNDLVKYMRNPGPGMTKYDMNDLPDKDAWEVAKYILQSYKK
ncbi:MAG TPA: c-type cytochrome [Geobacteraceae bacterium]|nr:c-type cytochrome [Geobacteraceae bacterium]